MPVHATRPLKASATWVIAGAFLLAVASIAVVTTLQRRADSARDAQVTLAQVQTTFDDLQSVPYDTIDATAVERGGPAPDTVGRATDRASPSPPFGDAPHRRI
jgi:hypothetical protein